MAYAWDAFFSYKRDRESDRWHERVREKLAHWASLELGREVRIFMDAHDIAVGARWSSTLTDALRDSRCLVCLWSPLYFRSRWCVSEWKSFLEREQRTGRSLIVPASYFDGQTFPEQARATQFLDFSGYASTMPRFWDTELAVQFEPHLRRLAGDLAQAIRRAPPHDGAFPVVEATEDDLQDAGAIGRIADV